MSDENKDGFVVAQTEFFNRYLDGDHDALYKVLELERGVLFDYLSRMMGADKPAAASLGEVIDTVLANYRNFSSLAELRWSIYSTARNFNAHAWQRPSSNVSMEPVKEGKESLSQQLDAAVEALPSQEREALLLHYRVGFSELEAARIMGFTESRVRDLAGLALQRLDQAFGEKIPFPDSLGKLSQRSLMEESSHATMAVSQLIRNVSRTRRSYLGLKKLPLLFGAAIVIALAVFFVRYFFMPP